MRHMIALLALAALITGTACAGEFADFPEFRYSSGLPGGGYGVDPAGHVGFDGALQMNIPVGYTPGAGNYAAAASSASVDGGLPTSFRGKEVNGTLAWGLGFFGEHALWIMDMGTGEGKSLESAYNVQFQVVRETEKRPGIAIGVTDLFDERAETRLDPFSLHGGARSFFVVATREAGTPEKPLYYSLGFGNGRFNNRPFGGVSYQPSEKVKVFAEYDGWNPNFGGAYHLWDSGEEFHAVVTLGVVDFDRINVGLALTRTGK